MWNRGGVHIDVPPEKLKMLQVRYSPAVAQAATQPPQPTSSGSTSCSRSNSSTRPAHWLYE